MKTKEEIKALVAEMTLEEKTSLCSGLDFWHTKPVERLGIPSIMVTDGPHGLRKQNAAADHLGINESVPATCFPLACATASSFDRELLAEIGAAMGEECLQEEVSVILGPGANIKRSPLCGRNFEYFSEDPVLSGECAGALIRGVESKGVGTSLKHFAANNQEKGRMVTNSVVDERALREIYLKSFEIAVKKGKPATVMCAYNRLNGTYCCENQQLLTSILRDEWGFDGVVVTDWGAMDDRVEALKAGLELEMPATGGATDRQLAQAVRAGALDEAVLDQAVQRLLELTCRTAPKGGGCRYDAEAHHALARKAAAGSAVLLKNEGGLLPIKPGAAVAVIGAFAKAPRYQGAGSSKINPHRVDTLADSLTQLGIAFDYAPGYSLTGQAPDDKLIAEACAAAKGKDVVIIAAGLPDEYESEGFDRTTLAMPESHNRLIAQVSEVNRNVAVVLMAGSVVLMPWLDAVGSLLCCHLTGQAGGGAIADLLTGRANPSGKLAESYPLSLDDTPCRNYFPGGARSVEYRESIFVGYRFYDTVGRRVQFPFGYGLSYTTFGYDRLSAAAGPDGSVAVSVEVKNTGSVPGAEVVQLYTAKADSAVPRPKKELKDFTKIWLAPGESKTVFFTLPHAAFAFWSAQEHGWRVEGGAYEIIVGASNAEPQSYRTVQLVGDLAPKVKDSGYLPEYSAMADGRLTISDEAFGALYGSPLPPSERAEGEPFTANSTLGDIAGTPLGDQLMAQARQQMSAMLGDSDSDIRRMFEAMMLDLPLRALGMMSGGAVGPQQIAGMVAALNGGQ